MLTGMDATLRAHLDRHHGVVSARQASELGLTANHLRALVRSGELVRVTRGAYVDAALVDGGTREGVHRAKLLAVVVSRGGALAASHQSAALLQGLPVLRSELEPVRVVHTTDRVNTRRHDAFTVHPCPGREALSDWNGVPTVVPAVAVLGTAMLAGARSGLMAADAALHRRMTTREELHEWLARLAHHPGVALARQVVTQADGRAESPGESLLRSVLQRLGYEVVPQFIVRDGHTVVARVDFLLPALGVVVEFDGLVKYDGQGGRAALAAEKERERRIRRLGYGVARIVWSDLFDDRRVEAEIAAASRTR